MTTRVLPDFDKWGQLIRHFEGFKPQAYQDSGKIWTIGFGSTFNHSAKRRVQKGDVITLQEATKWMQKDFSEIIRLANVYIRQPLNLNQSTAICDYIYNRGIGSFLKTQLDELINANPNDPRILNEIMGTGLKDRLGRVLLGLKRRRKSQAHLYSTGEVNFFQSMLR
jgi:lysozyme